MNARVATLNSLRALIALTLVLAPAAASAQLSTPPPELAGVDVTEHLNAPVPGDAVFRDHEGRTVRLGQYFDGRRPVVLNLVYHRCAMLCSLVLNATVNGLRQTAWTAGEQFQVVTISIDPHETAATAGDSRFRRLREYGRPAAERGWHFLVGDEANIRRVATAVGWGYAYDARQNEYAHPAAIMLLTPSGRVARYLYGIQYDPNDLRIGLLEASEGRSISTVERVLMWCYHYDPAGRKYVIVARRVMQLGGAVTVLALAVFFLFMWRRERRNRARGASMGTASSTRKDSVAGIPATQDPRG